MRLGKAKSMRLRPPELELSHHYPEDIAAIQLYSDCAYMAINPTLRYGGHRQKSQIAPRVACAKSFLTRSERYKGAVYRRCA
jgi:hypothetical protein